MRIYIIGQKVDNEYKKIVRACVHAAIKELGQPQNLSVCVNFVNDDKIHELNREMRGVDRITDVLSFPLFSLAPGEILDTSSMEAKVCSDNGIIPIGDMAIDICQLARQAKEYGQTTEQELAKLVVHSMCHLFGYDHIKDEDYAIMKPMEDKILSKLTKF